jgi:hypothetical protein
LDFLLQMPSFAATGVPPDMTTWQGRGWEPERTYHTPRADAGRSAKSGAGGGRASGAGGGRALHTQPAAHWCDNSLQQERRAGWESLDAPAAPPEARSVQPGLATPTLRARYQQSARSVSAQATFPGPAHLGEGLAHVGFDPQRAVVGREAGWARAHSTKHDAADGRSAGREASAAPLLMQGRVLAGGRPPQLAEHHANLAYVSPDRALVGAEERTAMGAALRQRGRG